MAIKPLQDRVLLKRVEEEERSVGGIIIPDTAKEKPMRGDVIAVGPGAKDENAQHKEMSVKQGDRVMFNKFAGTEIQIEGEEHLIMREDEIIALIE